MTKPTEHPVTDPLATVEPGSASSEGTPERYVGVAGGEPELIGQGGMGRVVAVYDTHLGREVARKELASCAPLDGGTLAEHSDHPSLEELMAGGHIAESHLRICAACRVEIRLFRDAFGEVEPGSTGGVEASEEASAGPPSLAERFLLEARVTARLEHPSIIPVYELGRRPDGTLYYTMKRVRGRTLGQALDSCGDLTERLALLGHFVDLCQGVAYAHDKGVIHRDLKPQNVMLGEFGETVLLDWGLARELGGPDHGRTEPSPGLSAVGLSGGGRTMDGSVLGTLQYMSPEQARGEVEYMDARSDIWSLGAVLYEILAGAPPYPEEDLAATLERVRIGQISDLELRCPDAPAELVAVARRALSPSPAGRYGTAGALAAEVESWRVGGRVSAYAYSSSELLRRFASEHRRLLTVIAGALVLLFVVASSAFVRVTAERDRALEAERAMEIALRGEELRGLVLAAADRERAGRPSLALPLVRAATALDATLEAGLEGWDGEVELTRLVDQPVVSWVLPHAEPVSDLAWSPAGDLLATASDTLRLWNVHDGSAREISGAPGVEQIVFADGGALLVASDAEHRVRVWDAQTGELRFELTRPGGHHLPHWSARARILVTAGVEGGLALWDLRTGDQTGMLGTVASSVTALALSSDGRWLVAGYEVGSLELWDLDDRSRVQALDVGAAAIGTVAVSEDGAAFAAGAADGVARSWRTGSDTPATEIEHFQGRSTSALAFSPTGPQLAAASMAGGLGMWGEDSSPPLWSLWSTVGPTHHAEFSKDGELLALASTDPRLWVVRAEDGAVIARLSGHERALDLVRWSPDGELLASTGADRTVRIWQRPRARWLHDLGVEGAPVFDVAWSARGDRVATAHQDGLSRIWDPATGALLHEIGEPGGHPVVRVQFSPDGSRLASESSEILVNDVTTGETIFSLGEAEISRWSQLRFSPDGHELAASRYRYPPERWNLDDGSRQLAHAPGSAAMAMAVDYSPDGAMLATGNTRGVISLWDTATGTRLRTLEGWGKNVPDLAFSPSGDVLAACYTLFNRVLLWDPRSGEVVETLDGHTDSVATLGFAADGQLLVTGSMDGSAIVWDLEAGVPLHRLEHGGTVFRVRVTPDGTGVLTGASPMSWGSPGETIEAIETARLWDLRSGTQLRVLEGHLGGVSDMAFSPSGDRVVVGALDGFARVWRTGLSESADAFSSTGAQTNLRVCRGTHRVVAVLPFPNADGGWAPPEVCGSGRVAEKKSSTP